MRNDDDHRISIERVAGTVKVMFSDAIIAASERALILREPGRLPVYYLPLDDVYLEFLERSATQKSCPPKGVASYWNARAMREAANEVMWTYEEPSQGFEILRGHGGFCPDKVVTRTFAPARVARAHDVAD